MIPILDNSRVTPITCCACKLKGACKHVKELEVNVLGLTTHADATDMLRFETSATLPKLLTATLSEVSIVIVVGDGFDDTK